jgi:DNA polymerase II small subunit
VKDFVGYFRARFKQMEPMVRPRLKNPIVSINKLITRSQNDKVGIIGMVKNINETKNGHIMIDIEDLTGEIKVIVMNNKKDFNGKETSLFNNAKELVLDEVIGLDGIYGKDLIFADDIYFAEMPLIKELKKSPKEEYAIFIGDPHVGANHFLKEEFKNMIDWLCGKEVKNKKVMDVNNNISSLSDEEEKNIISKINYIVVTGDVIDGVGIYPGQEADLEIKNVREQFEIFVDYIKKIPKHIQIIISGGNHEPMRIAEPQPPIYKEFAKDLWDMPNVAIVSNPAIINIGSTTNFEGFEMLIYHGYSFIYYADINEDIRSQGGLTRADLIMQLLLKKRHLAPTHGSTLYIPDSNKDNLVIEKIPDFFVTGHIHRLTTVPNHKGVTLLNCSTWMGETDFQEKVGLKPQVAKLPIVNLKTREIKVIDFEIEKKEEEIKDE